MGIVNELSVKGEKKKIGWFRRHNKTTDEERCTEFIGLTILSHKEINQHLHNPKTVGVSNGVGRHVD